MKIWTVLVRIKLESDQHPKTPVIHKVGGYSTCSDIRRGLDALANAGDGRDARPTSFCAKLRRIRQEAKILHSEFGSEVRGEVLIRSPLWNDWLFCFAVSKTLGHFPEGFVELHILIDALDGPGLGHPATVRTAT